MKLKINADLISHVGLCRDNNEDNGWLCGKYREDVGQKEFSCSYRGTSDKFLAAVADGMGGEADGEMASLITIVNLIPSDAEHMVETARMCVEEGNKQVVKAATDRNARMGSTLVALFIDGDKGLCCNVGDSRLYRVRKNVLEQISTDHSRAEEKRRAGLLTAKEATEHRDKHILTRYMGMDYDGMIMTPTLVELDILPGDVYLLCSDGLTDMVTDEVIQEIINNRKDTDNISRELLRQALDNGGKDNVTILAIKIEEKRSLLWKLR